MNVNQIKADLLKYGKQVIINEYWLQHDFIIKRDGLSKIGITSPVFIMIRVVKSLLKTKYRLNNDEAWTLIHWVNKL